jgi:hypothetical protein
VSKPLNDDLGSRFFTGGHNPKKAKKERQHKEPPVTFAELDEVYWRIQRLYGRQDG